METTMSNLETENYELRQALELLLECFQEDVGVGTTIEVVGEDGTPSLAPISDDVDSIVQQTREILYGGDAEWDG